MKGSTKFYLGITIFVLIPMLIKCPVFTIVVYLLYSFMATVIGLININFETSDEPSRSGYSKGRNYYRNVIWFRLSIFTIFYKAIVRFNKYLDKKL